MQRQRQRPESVSVAVSPALAFIAHIPRTRGALAYLAQVSHQLRQRRYPQRAIFHAAPQRHRQIFLHPVAECHALHLQPVAQPRFLCQLHADARGIYAHPAHIRQAGIVPQQRRLLMEGRILHFNDAAGNAALPVHFHQVEHGQIMLAAYVHSRVVFLARVKRQLPLLITRHAARIYQVIADERTGIIAGFAHVLLPETLFIDAAAADEIEIRSLVHLLPRVILRQLRLQLPQKSLVQRIFQRHPVQADAHRVPIVADFLNQLIKKILAAAVCRYDFQLAAPGDARVRNRPQLARVRVQRKLIQHAIAAFARLRVRVAAHAVDAAPVGHRQHIRAHPLFIIYHLQPHIRGRYVQDVGKVVAIFLEQPRLQIIAAAYPRITARIAHTLAPHQRIGRCPAHANLAAFLYQLQPAAILNPRRLIRQKE